MRKVRRITIAMLAAAIGLWLAIGATTATASMTAHVRIVENETTHKYRFKPPTITVQKGDKVVWNNKSDTAHTVTFGAKYNKTVGPGGHVSRTFPNAGTFKYHCTIHTYMHGTVVVQ
jgi:plastocyanin